jgi:hypothetical protein
VGIGATLAARVKTRSYPVLEQSLPILPLKPYLAGDGPAGRGGVEEESRRSSKMLIDG